MACISVFNDVIHVVAILQPACVHRVDSRLRECDNYAFFAVLAPNFKFPAWLLPQNFEIWRNYSNPVRIFGPSGCISVPLIYSIPLILLISANFIL